MEKAVAAAESLKGDELQARVQGLRQELEGTVLSASLKPLLRKRVDDLGKRAAAEKRAAGQGAIDQAVAEVGETGLAVVGLG